MTRCSWARPTWAALRMMACLSVGAMVASGPATAGPTSYDPKSRSFRLTYTYAAVPAINSSAEQIAAAGTRQTASKEQDAQVRAVHAAVSDQLSQATGGRARVGSLDFVDEIRAADIVISLTGDPGRSGAADLGTIDSRPGQLRIFYETIAKNSKNDVALTTLHELCHYLFALPDEYQTNLQPACPATNLNGPGCIMDNYFSGVRNGWYGRFCGPDHNPAAPQPGTVISSHSAGQSCQEIVDDFFRKFDLTGPAPSDADPAATPVDPDRPFSGPFKDLVAATSSYLRSPPKADDPAAKAATRSTSPSALRTRAERFLREQVARNRGRAGFVEPTATQLRTAIARAVTEAIAGPTFNPKTAEPPSSRFDTRFVEVLLGKARELAQGVTPRSNAMSRSRPGSSDRQTERTLRELQQRVGRELVAFAKTSLRFNDRDLPREQRALSPAEAKFIEQVARTASAEATGGTTEFGTFLKAAYLHVELDQEIAANVGRIADELGIPGTENRDTRIRAINTELGRTDLSRYALPGRTAFSFGERKTLLVAPLPRDPAGDFIPIQAGRDVAYPCIRDLVLNQFIRLIRRERPEVVTEDSPNLPGLRPASLSVGRRSPYTAEETQAVVDRRYQRFLAILAYLTDEVRRNRVENIAILVPPGGLPDELGQAFESFRERMLYGADVRLDLIFIGTATVPDRLRDLQVRTGGSAMIAFDVDDVGAIAQRLKKEGVSGSWVIPPQKGIIDFTNRTQNFGVGDPDAAPVIPDTSVDSMIKLFEETVRKPLIELNWIQSRLIRAIDRAPRMKVEALNVARPVLDDMAQVRARLQQIRTWLTAIHDNQQVDRNRQAIKGAILEIRGLLSLHAGELDQLQTCLLSTDEALDAEIKSAFMRRAGGLLHQYRTLEQRALESERRANARVRQGVAEPDQPDGLPRTVEEAWSIAAREHRDAAESAVRAAWLLKNYTAYDHEQFKDRTDDLSSSTWRNKAAAQIKLLEDVERRMDLAARPMVRKYLGSGRASETGEGQGGAARQYRIASEIAADLAKLPKGVNDLFEIQYDLRRFAGAAYERAAMALDPTSRDDLKPVEAVPMPLKSLPTLKSATISRSKLADFVEVVESEPREDATGRLDLVLHPSFDPNSDPTADPDPNTLDTPVEARELVEENLPVLVNNMLAGIIRIEDMFMKHLADAENREYYRTVLQRLRLPDGATLRAFGDDGKLKEIPLQKFQAEDNADFQLILNLTRPMQIDAIKANPPVMVLYRDDREIPTPYLQIDRDATTDTMLVYQLPNPRLSAGRIPAGMYTPKILFREDHLPAFGFEKKVTFTFSVATDRITRLGTTDPRPNVQLIAALRQDPPYDKDKDPIEAEEVAYRGLVRSEMFEAIVEVQVNSGAPVKGVDVTGSFQRISLDPTDSQDIRTETVQFMDDGKAPDMLRDDGIYTAKIPLEPPPRKDAVYRVIIQAMTTDESEYTGVAEAIGDPNLEKAVKDELDAGEPVAKPNPKPDDRDKPSFQRATSLTFRAKP